jgi:hypothetical protein
LVALVNQTDLWCRALDITASVRHVRGATLAFPAFLLKAFGCAPISIHQVAIIALDHAKVESITAYLNTARIVRVGMLSHARLILACQTSVLVELVSRPAGVTIEARHALASQAGRVAIIASEGWLNRTIL